MWLLASLGTACCFGVNNTLFKWGATKDLSKISIQFFFYLTSFILVLIYGIIHHSFHMGTLTLVIGGLAGILNTNGNIQMTKAFEKGPASITSTLIAMNAIIPVMAAAIFFPESISLIHWIGILLMIGSAVIVQYQPKNRTTPFAYKPWLFRTFLALLSIGSVGFLMKVSAYQQIGFMDLLVTMYGGGFVYLCLFIRKESFHRTEVGVAALVGVLSVVGFACYLYALQVGPASIIFPIISLNCLVVVLSGIVFFKERLKSYQAFGIFFALVGLVLTKI
jgi:drug/metabolite transporter (DMT)-like permease